LTFIGVTLLFNTLCSWFQYSADTFSLCPLETKSLGSVRIIAAKNQGTCFLHALGEDQECALEALASYMLEGALSTSNPIRERFLILESDGRSRIDFFDV
jgi:phosphotransferase system HPr-like phosphotransfer protein